MLVGLCDVCSAPARYRCVLCGRLVCAMHYDRESGMCIFCSAGREVRGYRD